MSAVPLPAGPVPAHPAATLVTTYLRTMEARDLDAARAMLAPGFTMIFPGDKRFDSLDQLVASARTRYRSARKTFERIDVAESPDGSVAVYVFGTLYGELLSGATYAGIRYVDRFTVRDGKLVDQRVWNDMAEMLGDQVRSPR